MTSPETNQSFHCRYIKSSGHPCRGVAIRGQLYCYSHGRDLRRHRNSSCTAPIHVPRLDNRDDIQQLITDVARAVAAEVITHATARLLFTAARLASAQLPPPRDYEALRRLRDKETPAPEPEPVQEVVIGPDGEDLAPETPYQPAGQPKRRWSLLEYLYHQAYPGNEDKPLPEEGYGNRLASLPQSAPPETAPPPTHPSSEPWNSPNPVAAPPTPATSATPNPGPISGVIDNLYAVAEGPEIEPQYRSTTPRNPMKTNNIQHPPHIFSAAAPANQPRHPEQAKRSEAHRRICNCPSHSPNQPRHPERSAATTVSGENRATRRAVEGPRGAESDAKRPKKSEPASRPTTCRERSRRSCCCPSPSPNQTPSS